MVDSCCVQYPTLTASLSLSCIDVIVLVAWCGRAEQDAASGNKWQARLKNLVKVKERVGAKLIARRLARDFDVTHDLL